MLKNAYLDAKIGFDRAEYEPSKVRGFLIAVGRGETGVFDIDNTNPSCWRRIIQQRSQTA